MSLQFYDIFRLDNDYSVYLDYLKGEFKLLNKEEKLKLLSLIKVNKVKKIEEDYKKHAKLLNTKEMKVVLIPSYYCNMRCEYCYEGKIKYNSPRLTEETIPKIVNQILKLYNEKKFNKICFVLLGGEPIEKKNLEWFKLFFDYIKYNDNLNYEIYCVSNGLEVDNCINKIKEIGIESFQITLDGGEKSHNKRRCSKNKNINSFLKVCNSIDILLKNDIQVIVRANIDESNVKEIENISNIVLKKKWNINNNFSIYIYPITMSGETKKKYLKEDELFDRVLEFLKTLPDVKKELFLLDFHGISFVNEIFLNKMFLPKFNYCDSSNSQYVFDAYGNLATCWWGTRQKEFIIGDLNYIDYNNINKWENININKIKKCIPCKYKYICGAGCSYKAFLKKGTPFEGNCSEFKKIIKNYLTKYIFEDERKVKLDLKKEEISKNKLKLLKKFIKNYGFFIINSIGKSMSGINGEIIIKHEKNYYKNDIVLFQKKDGSLILHRILSKNKNNFLIKGDNEIFLQKVSINRIIGKYVSEKVEKKELVSKSLSIIKKKYTLKLKFLNSRLTEVLINGRNNKD